jgi:hypothetical protein
VHRGGILPSQWSLCGVRLLGGAIAWGEPPQSRQAALEQSSIRCPSSVRLSAAANLILQYEHRFRGEQFFSTNPPSSTPNWMTPLAWSRHYVLETDYWSPHAYRRAVPPLRVPIKGPERFLNPLLPLGSTLRRIAGDFAGRSSYHRQSLDSPLKDSARAGHLAALWC